MKKTENAHYKELWRVSYGNQSEEKNLEIRTH